MLKKIILFTLILTALHGQGQECSGVIRGYLSDFHDKSFLEGAKIAISDQQYTYSDSTGFFELRDLCPGAYTLQISHPSCATLQKTIELSAAQSISLNLTLEHHYVELAAIDVFGNNTENQAEKNVALSQKQYENLAGKNFSDLLESTGAVNLLRTGSTLAKPIIDGQRGSRLITSQNGMRVEDMEWGDEHAPSVITGASNTVRLIKGVGALAYGSDALGGVIVLERSRPILIDSTRTTVLSRLQTAGRGGVLQSNFESFKQTGRFIEISAAIRQLGDLKAPNYLLSNTGTTKASASLNIGKTNGILGFEFGAGVTSETIGILRASHIGSVSDLIRAINSGEPLVIEPFTYNIDAPKQEVNHLFAQFKLYKRFENRHKLEMAYHFQRNNRKEFDVRRDRANIPGMDQTLSTQQFTATLDWSINRITAKSGIDIQYQLNKPNPDTGVRRLIPDYKRFNSGLFTTLKKTLSSDFSLDLGGRFDYRSIQAQKFYLKSRFEALGYLEDYSELIVQDVGNQWYTEIPLNFPTWAIGSSINYAPNNYLSVSSYFNRTQRAPSVAELFSEGLHHSAAQIELGDLRLTTETSYKTGLESAIVSGNHSFRIHAYYQKIDNYITLEPSGVEYTLRGAFPVWQYLQTDATFWGFDSSMNLYVNQGLSYTLTANYTQARDTKRNQYLIGIPPLSLNQRITVVSRRNKSDLLTLHHNFIGLQKRTPDNLSIVTPGSTEQIVLLINNAPKAAHVFNVSVALVNHTTKHYTINIDLAIENLLDTTYRNYLNSQRYYADEVGRNMLLTLRLVN